MDQIDNFDIAARSWTTTQQRNRGSLHQWCDLAIALETVRGQWKSSILIALSETACDIPRLQKRLAPANRRVLVRALRQLEAEALIERSTECETVYTLTPDGMSLTDILHQLADWQKTRIA